MRADDAGGGEQLAASRRPRLIAVAAIAFVTLAAVMASLDAPHPGTACGATGTVGTSGGEGEAVGPAGCSDDFDGAAGSPPDSRLWTVETGAGGWGNNEIQEYTADGVYLDGNSRLVIEARRMTTPDGAERWTSGRLTSKGKASYTSGTLSARIQLPDGQGLLPAFWMLGDSIDQVGWPAAGEIDVVETPGNTATSFSNIHGPDEGSPGAQRSVETSTAHDEPLSTAFHIYSVERSPGRIVIAIDGGVVADVTPESVPETMKWVFDEPFHALFSLAVGGNWPGNPDHTTPDVARMVVDWVRHTPLADRAVSRVRRGSLIG